MVKGGLFNSPCVYKLTSYQYNISYLRARLHDYHGHAGVYQIRTVVVTCSQLPVYCFDAYLMPGLHRLLLSHMY